MDNQHAGTIPDDFLYVSARLSRRRGLASLSPSRRAGESSTAHSVCHTGHCLTSQAREQAGDLKYSALSESYAGAVKGTGLKREVAKLRCLRKLSATYKPCAAGATQGRPPWEIRENGSGLYQVTSLQRCTSSPSLPCGAAQLLQTPWRAWQSHTKELGCSVRGLAQLQRDAGAGGNDVAGPLALPVQIAHMNLLHRQLRRCACLRKGGSTATSSTSNQCPLLLGPCTGINGTHTSIP